MPMTTRAAPVLLAEDDEHDQFFVRLAFERAGVVNPLVVVPDGQAAIEYLRGIGAYADRSRHPLPCLLVTDLKMPKVDGFELLRWLQTQPQFRDLRKIVISSSCQETDLKQTGELGASAYFQKPSDLKGLVQLVREWNHSWLGAETARAPSPSGPPGYV